MSKSRTESWVPIKVEPAELKELMRRQDAHPIRDFELYFLPLAGLACLSVALWGHWSATIALFAYGTLYSTGAQLREHETSHGNALRAKWLNRLFSRSQASWRCARPFFARTVTTPLTNTPSSSNAIPRS